jgi:hypothetical protein
MLRRTLLVACALGLAPVCLAQTKIEATDLVRHPFSAAFASGGKLKLKIRSGDIRVVGTTDEKISVELSGRKAWDAGDVKVRFEQKSDMTELKVSGGPKNDLTITVRIPASTDLHARIPAGEVHIEGITGNKDVEIHAGDLTVDVGDTADYAHIEASVYTGELDALALGVNKGGLFRSIKKEGSGRYRLHAHVGAGQLTLQ